MNTRSLLTITFAVVLAAVGIVWIKSLVPPESPSGSLQFLSAAPELPIFDRAGQGRPTSRRRRARSSSSISGRPGARPASRRSRPSRASGTSTARATTSPSTRSPWTRTGRRSTTSWRRTRARSPLFHDPGAATAKRFGTTQYPETYIINDKGRVLFRVQGAVDWSDADVRARIEQLIAS